MILQSKYIQIACSIQSEHLDGLGRSSSPPKTKQIKVEYPLNREWGCNRINSHLSVFANSWNCY